MNEQRGAVSRTAEDTGSLERSAEVMQLDIARDSAAYYLEAFTELTARPTLKIGGIAFKTPVARPSINVTVSIEGADAYLVRRLGLFIADVRDPESTKKQDPARIGQIIHDTATLILDSRQK